MAGFDKLIKELLSNTDFAKKKVMSKTADNISNLAKKYDSEEDFFDNWAKQETATNKLHDYLRQQATKKYEDYYDPVRDNIDFSIKEYIDEYVPTKEDIINKIKETSLPEAFDKTVKFSENAYNKGKSFAKKYPKTSIGLGGLASLALIPDKEENIVESELQKQLLISSLHKQGLTDEQIEQYLLTIGEQ